MALGRKEGLLEGKQEGKLEGILEGKLEGQLEAKRAIAKNLLATGIDFETISQATGLSVQDIKQLRDNDQPKRTTGA